MTERPTAGATRRGVFASRRSARSNVAAWLLMAAACGGQSHVRSGDKDGSGGSSGSTHGGGVAGGKSPIEATPNGFFQVVVTHDRQRELQLRWFFSEDVSYDSRRLGSGEVTSADLAAAPDGTLAIAFRVAPDYIPNGDSDRLEPGYYLVGFRDGAEIFRTLFSP